jgi:sugar lactone lactonase YvrE
VPDLEPEGIAYDAGSFYAGSIKKREILRVVPGKSVEVFATTATEPMDSPLGLRVDRARGLLWAATEADPDQEGFGEADRGRSALLAFDLATGVRRRVIALPRDVEHLLNDITLDADGTLYATDSAGGRVWILGPDDGALRPLTPAGALIYPNGIAWRDGALFVADAMGIWRVDHRGGAARLLACPPGVSVGAFDGLYASGDGLVGVQNVGRGRIVALTLSAARDAVIERWILESAHPAFDEPTTGAIVDSALYVLANTAPNDGATIVVKTELNPRR